MTEPVDPKAIYQAILDNLSRVIGSPDLASVLDYVKLPIVVRTAAAELIVETETDLRSGLLQFGNSLRSQGMNHFIQLAESARYLSDDYIEAFHVTHTLRNAISVVPPFQSRAIVRKCDDGRWRLTETNTTLANDSWPIVLPRVHAGELQLMCDSDPDDDIRVANLTPGVIYQECLDRISAANMAQDFDLYCNYCHFPHTFHTEKIDAVINEPADILPFFDMVSNIIIEKNVDFLDRVLESAEFLSGDLICGYHNTTLYSKNEPVLGPIQSRMIFRRVGTRWLQTPVTNSVANAEFPYAEPVLTDGLVTLRQIQERTRK
jgi:hypothetical protein